MKKTARILALVLVLVFLFSTVAYAADEPRQADVGERTSWEKNAEVNEKYAPRVKVMENGVRVQKTPYNTTALDTQAGDVESKTITAWNNYFLNADNRGCTACHTIEDALEMMESYHGIIYARQFGKMGYITKVVSQLMRDLGSIPAPMNSFILNLGLQSLHLRMRQHCSNAQKVAEYLHDDPRVAWVHYAGLRDDRYHAIAEKYMPQGTCGVMAFGLKGDREVAVKFMDSLEMINIETHVADTRTCVLHPASHTHRQLTDEQLRQAGIAPDLIRLSVGIEDVEDILDDIRQALDKI